MAATGGPAAEKAVVAPDFIVHEDGDCVGVVVVEGIKAGQRLNGWVMAQDRSIAIEVSSDVPIGHKLALKDFAVGDTLYKYGVDIGRVVAPIRAGDHVHVHNLKTKRW